MSEFLKTWYGLTLFIIFDAAAVLAVMAIAFAFFPTKNSREVSVSRLPFFFWYIFPRTNIARYSGERTAMQTIDASASHTRLNTQR